MSHSNSFNKDVASGLWTPATKPVVITEEELSQLIRETESNRSILAVGFGPFGAWLHPGQPWALKKLLEWRQDETLQA